jgi:hypothetical protein
VTRSEILFGSICVLGYVLISVLRDQRLATEPSSAALQEEAVLLLTVVSSQQHSQWIRTNIFRQLLLMVGFKCTARQV